MRTCNKLCAAAVLAAATAVAGAGELSLDGSVRKIWDQADHNAFTDLVRFDGDWYCAFREGSDHAASLDGTLRVIGSTDNGANWSSVATFSNPTADLRDAMLNVTAGGQLMLSGATWTSAQAVTHRTYAWFSSDGVNWTGSTQIGQDNAWLWKPVFHGGKGYCAARIMDTQDLRLYEDADGDGLNWTVKSTDISSLAGGEAAIVFTDSGTAYMLHREGGGSNDGELGVATAPYDSWTFTASGTDIGGPDMIQTYDGRLLAATRLYGSERTSLSWVDASSGKITEDLTLPSGGDCSYAGMVWHEDQLWVSYYSSHEGKASIYLAKVNYDPDPVRGAVCAHYGAADPVNDEDWALNDGGGGGVSVGAVSNDLGTGLDAWKADDNSTASNTRIGYEATLSRRQQEAALTEGWVLRAKLRIVDAPDAADSSVFVDFAYNHPDYDKKWFYMKLGAEADGDPIISLYDLSDLVLAGAGGGYHLYEFVYDPDTGTADLFVDGVEKVSNFAGRDNSGYDLNRILWGANGSASTGHANYNLIELEILPEPGALAFLAVGAALALARRRRRH